MSAEYVRRIVKTATVIAARDDIEFVSAAVAASGTLHRYAASQPDAVPLPGRGTVFVLNAGAERWVVRHYQRGGAIAGWLGDRYLRGGLTRPEAELLVSGAARKRGIATPRIAAAVVYPDGAFYRGDIAPVFIPDSTDLAVLTLGDTPWEDEDVNSAWYATGELLRDCFAGGLLHPDLNLKNIVVQKTAGAMTAHVIDLDRAHIARSVSGFQRERMLARFHRSREKIEGISGRSVNTQAVTALREGLGR